MPAKNTALIFILISVSVLLAESVAVVFSGSNNGYFRDCG